MNSSEWEALCDKCGKCCVIKLEDYDTKEIHYTNISCKLLCEKTAVCKDYENRKSIVPDCKILTPRNLKNLKWMPKTCAYKLLNDGKSLPLWHPLISGPRPSRLPQSIPGDIFPEPMYNRNLPLPRPHFKVLLDCFWLAGT